MPPKSPLGSSSCDALAAADAAASRGASSVTVAATLPPPLSAPLPRAPGLNAGRLSALLVPPSVAGTFRRGVCVAGGGLIDVPGSGVPGSMPQSPPPRACSARACSRHGTTPQGIPPKTSR